MAKPLLIAQPTDAAVNSAMAMISSLRMENIRIKTPVRGIVTISAIR